MEPVVLTIPHEAVAAARLLRQGMEAEFSADWPQHFMPTASSSVELPAAWPEWKKRNGTTTLGGIVFPIP